MRSRLFIATLVVFSSGLASNVFAKTLGPGDAAPPIKVFRWVKGAPITEFDPSKIYVVEFWATWCGPCKMSIPHLTDLAKKYKDKVTFSGISVSESPSQKPGGTDTSYMSTVRQFVKDEGDAMNYNVGADSPTGYMSTTWMEAAGQDGIPTAFVIKDSKIAWIGHPMMGLDEALADMIAGKFDYAAEKSREAKVAADQAKEQAGEQAIQPFVQAMSDKKYKEAVTIAEQLMVDHPDMMDSLILAKFDALVRSDPVAANGYAKSVAAGDAKAKPAVLNGIAWTMIDDAEGLKGMDYGIAEAVATQAVSLMKGDSTEYAETMDTLALAQFKNGKSADAISTEKKAIEMFKAFKEGDPQTLKAMQVRLKKYEAGKG